MFNFLDKSALNANPDLAQTLVKYLSLNELMDIAKKSDDNRQSILDRKPIIDGIMESFDEGKILFLASSSNLGDKFGMTSEEVFEKIFNMGDQFRMALYGNSKCDWYDIFIFKGHKYIDRVMNDIINGGEKFKIPFYKNPRMDRRLIASIIGAKNYLRYEGSFNFEIINFEERYFALKNSYNVVEIKSENYFGKDSPDDNELYFDKPYYANLRFLRDLIQSYTEKEALVFLRSFYFYLDQTNFDIDCDDWLSSAELSELDKADLEFTEKYQAQYELAFIKLLDFFDNHTKDIFPTYPPSTKESFDEYKYFLRSTAAINIIGRLLATYRIRDKAVSYTREILLKSKNWVMRAAAYNFIYQNIDVRNNFDLLNKFFEYYETDRLAFLHALFHTSRTRLLARNNYSLDRKFSDFLEDSGIDDLTKKYLGQTTSFAFGNHLRNLETEEFEKIFDSTMRDIRNNFAELVLLKRDPQEGQLNGDKLFQFGKFVSKILK